MLLRHFKNFTGKIAKFKVVATQKYIET